MTPLPPHLKEALRQRLKLPQYAVLRVIVAAGRPVTVAEIAEASGISVAGVYKAANCLYWKKLLRRSGVPSRGGSVNRRGVTYRLR